ncbi:11726_t:CDS:1, partial [Dentiscutata erythropus]
THKSSNNLIEDKEPDSRSGNNLNENEALDSEIIQVCKQKIEAVRHIADHFEQELAANNFNHVIHVTNNMNRLFTMLNDIETAQNRRRRN